MDVQSVHIVNPLLINGNNWTWTIELVLLIFILYWVGDLENSGLVNIRDQIHKLSSDLNITRKGLEVFSGERKTIVPSDIEIKFVTEFKKKMRKLKVIFFTLKCRC